MLFSDDLIFVMLELSLCYNHCIQYRQISGYDRPRCNLLIIFGDDIHVTVYNNCLQDGTESSGKTTLARMLSEIIGEELKVFSMNSAMDTTDLLGGFEQVSLKRSQ